MHEKTIATAYRKELFGAMALYVVLLFLSIRFGRPMADGVARTVVLLAPMLGFLAMIWAVARNIARIDEYQRKMLLETWALAAALTAALTFSYGFLETAGYPKISMFSVWMMLGGCWGLVAVVRSWMQR